jgi:hypothetical protein
MATGFLTGAGNPPASGKVRYNFPPDSTWVAVKGLRGACKILEASVTFQDGKVQIAWKAQANGGWYSVTKTYAYQLDPQSNLPRFKTEYLLWSARGNFRLVGNRLELNLEETDDYAPLKEPRGSLWLVLERAK